MSLDQAIGMPVSEVARLPSTASERRVSQGDSPAVLADIYQANTHMTIWHRALPAALTESVQQILKQRPTFKFAMIVTPQNTCGLVNEALHKIQAPELSHDIAQVVDMFCCLFEIERAGLRLEVLDRAMCPRFHVDRVPCRLISTYGGVATEWLPHAQVDRSKLGRGNDGLSDLEAGLYQYEHDVQQLDHGDVALLKGELWEGNENAGLVHRSPSVPAGASRLVLTLDVGA